MSSQTFSFNFSLELRESSHRGVPVKKFLTQRECISFFIGSAMESGPFNTWSKWFKRFEKERCFSSMARLSRDSVLLNINLSKNINIQVVRHWIQITLNLWSILKIYENVSVESGWNRLTLIDHRIMHTVLVDSANKQHLSLCTDFRDFKRYLRCQVRIGLQSANATHGVEDHGN